MYPDPATKPAETPLARALRRMAKRIKVTVRDVPVLEDAADELDEVTAKYNTLKGGAAGGAQASAENRPMTSTEVFPVA